MTEAGGTQLEPGIVFGRSPGANETKPPGGDVDILVSEKADRGKGNGKGND